MTTSLPRITESSFLTLHYRLSGPAGDIINTFNDKPATLSLGTGELSPAVEHCLLGLEEGAHQTFALAAGAAFGLRPGPVDQSPARLTVQAPQMIHVQHAGNVMGR